ncbi:hypothetical protein TNCV_3321061 [Trichonephila clavipes]|nr:hypothetical protein TNCV_3321061 [Trichonephila clavipes]
MIPGAEPMWDAYRNCSAASHPVVSKLESYHRDVTGKRSNEQIVDIPLCCKRRTMTGQRIMSNRPNLLCYDSRYFYTIHYCHAHNPPVIASSGAARRVQLAPSVRRFLLPPAMTDPHHSCLVSYNR